MARASIEKFGSVGAVLAALACPICFPKVALIGAALGLGALQPFEPYIALGLQALFVVALVGHMFAYRRHRNRWLLGLAWLATIMLFEGYYIIPSAILLQAALAALGVASVWLVLEMRRRAKIKAAINEQSGCCPITNS